MIFKKFYHQSHGHAKKNCHELLHFPILKHLNGMTEFFLNHENDSTY